MAQYRILLARFPARGDGPDSTDWVIRTVCQLKKDPRVSNVLTWYKADTPITMTRNFCMEVAKESNSDFVIMVDDDMKPDLYWKQDPKAKPFVPTALDFLIGHHGPGFIAAPYCGPPPVENIYVFKWATTQSNHPNIDFQIAQYTREEASVAEGIEEVAALPTGVCMFHTKCLDFLKPPYFRYEWKKGPNGEEFEMEKASTEDVYFTRNLAFAGVPQYVLWDSWAGHWKKKLVGKPGRISIKDVVPHYQRAVLDDLRTQFKSTGKCSCCGRHSAAQRFANGLNREEEAAAKKAVIEQGKADTLPVIEAAMVQKYLAEEQPVRDVDTWDVVLPSGLIVREAD